MAKNYKLGELAKDLKLPSADVIKCLDGAFGEAKKTVSSLTPEEVTYVFEYFTQKNQVESFDKYFASKNAKEEVKEEKPKKTEKKPVKKAGSKTDNKPENKPEKKTVKKARQEASDRKEPEKKAVSKAVKPENNNAEAKKPQQKKKTPPKKQDHGTKQRLVTTGSSQSGVLFQRMIISVQRPRLLTQEEAM